MNRSLLIGLVAGAGATTALGAVANYALVTRAPEPVQANVQGPVQRDAAVIATPATAATPEVRAAPTAGAAAPRATYARVVHVAPVRENAPVAREVCREEPVVQQAPVRDERRIAGTLVGALLGGVLGHQIGDGHGRRIATVAGAAAGGYAGNRIQDRMQKADTVTTTERRCETVYEPRERTVAYDVTYSYAGRTRTVRMEHAPGDRLPLRNGRVVGAS